MAAYDPGPLWRELVLLPENDFAAAMKLAKSFIEAKEYDPWAAEMFIHKQTDAGVRQRVIMAINGLLARSNPGG